MVHQIGVGVGVIGVGLQDDDAAGVLIAEQRHGVVGGFFEVTEGLDVAVGLDRVQDPVDAGIRLQESVGAQVDYEQRIQP